MLRELKHLRVYEEMSMLEKKTANEYKKRLNAINNTCMKSYCTTPNNYAKVMKRRKAIIYAHIEKPPII
jgi:hypothetical protein